MESVFRIGDRLGAGGGGEVFRAVDTRLNRPVAIKFLKGGDEREVARFRREAQLAGRLSNPNIAAIYEVGDLDGRPFIAMQLVEGRTLHGWQGTARDAVAMITVAARAVAFAHEQGIIHRDVKPDNLMVDGAGRIYVMDFGLARVAEGASSLSATGGIVGTPSYMSPEQARGERVDARADVWSLGATLYELLSGVPPFQAPNLMQLLARLQEAEPPPLRAVDAALAAIVRRCLEKEPSHRYATAAALADDLDRWARGEPIQARRRLPLRAIALVALAATALLSTVLFLRVSGSREAAARETLLANLRRTADTTLRAALELRRTGRTDAMEAQGAGFVEAATQAMRIAPDLAEPHHLMGRFHRARMRFPDAAAAQAEALRRDPGHVGALYESLFLELRETLAILPRKLEAAQRSATALTSDAELRQTLDRVAAKASHLSGAGLPPGRRECVLGFAALLRRDRACVEHLRRALQHDPDLEEARELLASFLLTCGRPEEAFEVCDGGVARDAGYAPFRYDRAGALLEIARRAVDPARSAGQLGRRPRAALRTRPGRPPGGPRSRAGEPRNPRSCRRRPPRLGLATARRLGPAPPPRARGSRPRPRPHPGRHHHPRHPRLRPLDDREGHGGCGRFRRGRGRLRRGGEARSV
jgi:tetratricopeptide (TPR) repeat protein/predicted Ser/Thr protein kinase